LISEINGRFIRTQTFGESGVVMLNYQPRYSLNVNE